MKLIYEISSNEKLMVVFSTLEGELRARYPDNGITVEVSVTNQGVRADIGPFPMPEESSKSYKEDEFDENFVTAMIETHDLEVQFIDWEMDTMLVFLKN